MGALLLAFLAGALTTINPCVLPLLPIVFASALTSGKFGPVALVAGLVASFTLVGAAIAASGSLLGLDERMLRFIAAIVFAFIGITLVVPAFEQQFSALFARAGTGSAALAGRASAFGIPGQFAVGLLLGAVWSPCSGPALGAAIGLAAQAGGVPQAALRLFVFGLGAASILLLLAFGSRAVIVERRARLAKIAPAAKQIVGAIFFVLGAAILTGVDKIIEAKLLDFTPDWLINLTTRF
jgi:cytochrome c biogenesis protein CcdA